LYQLNSLGLAMQFVRKGIKTTIVDMAGVSENESKESILGESKDDANNTIVGGLQGVVACDVLRLGRNNGDLCDGHSRLHLPSYDRPIVHENKRRERFPRDLTQTQLEEIDRVLKDYDCCVWKHLKKYQSKGILRVLYPSEHRFETCNPERSRDISFPDTLEKMTEIASQDNSIPVRIKSKTDAKT
jgi:hypothetical protein